MKKSRQDRIMEILEQQKVISIRELAERLECTEMTIRRNLDDLQDQNLVQRERGFARIQDLIRPTDYYEQSEERTLEKAGIAQAAFRYIHSGDSICLDSGTTTQQLALLIPEDLSLSIITPSLPVSMALAGHSSVQILMPGGVFHHSNRSLLIEDNSIIQQYHVPLAFMSCLAFRVPGGSFEHSQTMNATKKALASIADKRILLMDYSKWNASGFCNSMRMEEIDLIITDDKAPLETVEETASLGKEIVVVTPGDGVVAAHYNQND